MSGSVWCRSRGAEASLTLICFASQKGSPGATATALAVAAALRLPDGRQKLLVEADSTGGTLAIRYRLPVEPGLLTLAAAVRSGPAQDGLWHHTQELPGGLRVVVSPDGPEQVHAAMAASGAILGQFLAGLDNVDVLCDVGRLSPDSPVQAFVASASAVLMVARPNAEQLQPAARRMMMLRTQVHNVGWVLVGEKPYGAAEVESTYGFPVVGVMADDPRSVLRLENGVVTKKIRRSPFVRSATTLANTLADWLLPDSESVVTNVESIVESPREAETPRDDDSRNGVAVTPMPSSEVDDDKRQSPPTSSSTSLASSTPAGAIDDELTFSPSVTADIPIGFAISEQVDTGVRSDPPSVPEKNSVDVERPQPGDSRRPVPEPVRSAARSTRAATPSSPPSSASVRTTASRRRPPLAEAPVEPRSVQARGRSGAASSSESSPPLPPDTQGTGDRRSGLEPPSSSAPASTPAAGGTHRRSDTGPPMSPSSIPNGDHARAVGPSTQPNPLRATNGTFQTRMPPEDADQHGWPAVDADEEPSAESIRRPVGGRPRSHVAEDRPARSTVGEPGSESDRTGRPNPGVDDVWSALERRIDHWSEQPTIAPSRRGGPTERDTAIPSPFSNEDDDGPST